MRAALRRADRQLFALQTGKVPHLGAERDSDSRRYAYRHPAAG